MERIRYFTMNSWNRSTAPAYNFKIHRVIPPYLQSRVFELMEREDFYDGINDMVEKFGARHNYEWQARFNGRSSGYLVLYTGGIKPGHKSICTACGQRNYKTVEESGSDVCGRCGSHTRVNRDLPEIYVKPGAGIEETDVPKKVLDDFEKLAEGIVKHVIDMAGDDDVVEEEYTVVKKRKVLRHKDNA